MKVAVGSDHAGFELKAYVAQWLREHGYEVVDMGPFNGDSVDYPDYARKVGEGVASGGNFRSARDADALVWEREQEELSDKEADSLLAAAMVLAENGAGPASGNSDDKTAPGKEKRSSRRSEKKTFSGTIALNKATERQLQQIPGIGPVMAKRIVAFRALKAGHIERYEELLEVNGIGEKKLEAFKQYLTLD